AFITLTKRVKKLKTQLKQKRSRAVIYSTDEEEPSVHIEDSPKQGRIIKELDKDKDVNLEGGDSVKRAITTDASLESAQASDNILKTQTTTMPNVDISKGMYTGPRHQETIGSTRLRLGYTPGSDEGRLKLEELMDLCTILSNRVTTLENELSSTKAVYHKAFITLTKRVKKLETQLKQKRSRAVIHSSNEEEPSVDIEDSLKQGRMIKELDKDEDVNLVSEKGEVHETAELSKDDDDATLLSLDEDLAQKLYAEELAKETSRQEQEKYNLEKALELQRKLDKREEDVDKGDQTKEIDWNDPTVLRYHALQNRPFSKAEVRKNMCMYLKNQGGYKQSYFKRMKYGDIRPIFKRAWNQVYTFVPKDSEIEKEFMKRSRFHIQQESSKKQKLDQQTEEEVEAQMNSDQEVEEMKVYMRIVPDEDIAIDAIPLATKPPVIVEYMIVNEGRISTYHVIRADESTKRYTSMINLLENINREDLEALWKLVKDKHRNTRPEEGYERVL
nr:hypothetical protein [Tanacetum cinerariifolium]